MIGDLLSIPQEVLTHILSILDAPSLVCCAMTCKYIYKLLEESSILGYIIESHWNGVTDSGASSTRSYRDLVQDLRASRRAWIAPRWSLTVSAQVDDPNLPYECAGDTVVRRSNKHLEITTLRNTNKSSENHTKKRALKKQFSVGQSHFAIDPAQDLIILLENADAQMPLTETRIFYVHIRTLSSDDPHPSAQSKCPLEISIPPNIASNKIYGPKLEIARNIVMLQFHTAALGNEARQLRVLIWDWMSSKPLMDISSSSQPGAVLPLPHCNIVLLNTEYFLITSSKNNGSIELYQLVRSDTPNAPPIHHATLHLPSIRPHIEVDHIDAKAGPIETRPLRHTPFSVNDDDRIHVFSVDYVRWEAEMWWEAMPTIVYVHQRVFTLYCAKHSNLCDPPLDIPWTEWGPDNVRIVFPSCSQSGWSGHVHGQRTICPCPMGYDGKENGTIQNDVFDSLSVLDFSIGAILSAKGRLDGDLDTSESESKRMRGSLVPPVKILASDVLIYADDVENRLPCVSCEVDTQWIYDSYFLNADGIVCISKDLDASVLMLDAYIA
ncbi:hypothetical protein BDN70DRAFT_926265 [Pholiota conissans]|uniref:F-box domain-containing protein n=1 Tax=Pholiota conissans TaxID=109636 RepID=A0A9P6CLW4_9AGAR|nr:hypothetical protein BDN70DRAFT_926265 [Pholiota conissans]